MCSWSFPDGKPSHARGQHGLQSLGVASRERADGARVDGRYVTACGRVQDQESVQTCERARADVCEGLRVVAHVSRVPCVAVTCARSGVLSIDRVRCAYCVDCSTH